MLTLTCPDGEAVLSRPLVLLDALSVSPWFSAPSSSHQHRWSAAGKAAVGCRASSSPLSSSAPVTNTHRGAEAEFSAGCNAGRLFNLYFSPSLPLFSRLSLFFFVSQFFSLAVLVARPLHLWNLSLRAPFLSLPLHLPRSGLRPVH